MPEAMVQLDAVTKRFGTHVALHDLSLEIAPGECLALLGHNGAGKTTLMKLLLGLTVPSAGKVRVMSRNPTDSASRQNRNQIGFLPENVVFQGEMTGMEVLRFYARLKRVPQRVCHTLLTQVGLMSAAGRRVKTYSKGMRQRLGLAQAWLGRPRLLLLDEPTTGLDPALRRTFFALLSALKRDGTTIVLSSHLLQELEPRCDRMAILHTGRLLAVGSLPQLRQQTALPVHIDATALQPVGALVDALRPYHAVTQIDAHRLTVTCTMEEQSTVLSRLTGHGLSLNALEIRPPSLDDIYFFHQDGHPTAEEVSSCT